jgi:hypothetical protein
MTDDLKTIENKITASIRDAVRKLTHAERRTLHQYIVQRSDPDYEDGDELDWVVWRWDRLPPT